MWHKILCEKFTAFKIFTLFIGKQIQVNLNAQLSGSLCKIPKSNKKYEMYFVKFRTNQ